MPNVKQKKSILLDVDPSIIERNVTIVKDWFSEDDLKNVLPPSNTSSITVKPSPGFCIKAKIIREDKKVFINICHTDSIPSPDDITNDELTSILSSDEPSSYRVPMSIGEPKTENDKSGQPCTAYDIAISTQFLKKIEINEPFRTFFINVVFEGLQNKYEIELDIEEYVILKNRKSIGNLQVHRIQKRIAENKDPSKANKLLIEEMTPYDYNKIVRAKSTETKNTLNSQNTKESSIKKPLLNIDFQLLKTTNKESKEFLVVEFKMDKMAKSDDIILDVGEDRVIVEVTKTGQFQDIFLPDMINQKTAKGLLDPKNNIFTVIMEVTSPPMK